MSAQLAEEIESVKEANGCICLLAQWIKEKNRGKLRYFEELAIGLHIIKILEVHVIGQIVLIGQHSDLLIGKYLLFDTLAGSAPGGAEHDKVGLILKAGLLLKVGKAHVREGNCVVRQIDGVLAMAEGKDKNGSR